MRFSPPFSGFGSGSVDAFRRPWRGAGAAKRAARAWVLPLLVLTAGHRPATALGTPGELDTTFAPTVSNNAVLAIAVQPDHKIVIAGSFSGDKSRIARVNADGSTDNTFTPPNTTVQVNCLAVQADGKIIAGIGTSGTLAGVNSGLVRLNANGTLDNAFGNFSGTINSISIQPDGKILVAGSFNTTIGGVQRWNLVRFNADGTRDDSFLGSAGGVNLNTSAHNLLQMPGIGLLAGSSYATNDLPSGVQLMNADGVFTSYLGSDFKNVSCLVVEPGDRILVGGAQVGPESGSSLIRCNLQGVRESSFQPGIINRVNSLALQTDGKMIAGGEFGTLYGVPRNHLTRLTSSGAVDTSFVANGTNITNGDVFGVAIQEDGKVLVGGNFNGMSGVSRSNFGRFENTVPATQKLTVGGSGIIEWERGGSSPEAQYVTFELSTDGGTVFAPLGVATRMSHGWELAGLTLPASGHVRARARIGSGMNNGSSGLVETVAAYTTAAPEIRVELDGKALQSGDTVDFGDVLRGVQAEKNLLIRNIGGAPLDLGAVTLADGDVADFPHTEAGNTTLAPGESAALTLFFLTQSLGSRGAGLHLASNDADEGSFVVVLSGTGINNVPTLSSFEDVTITEDTVTSAIAFTIGDAEKPADQLNVNAYFLPSHLGSCSVYGVGAERTLIARPYHDVYGEFTITVTVDDGKDSVSRSFQLTVVEEPDFAEIEMKDEPGTVVNTGSFMNFGSVGAGSGIKNAAYTIKNLGTENLTGLSLSITGSDQGSFAILAPPGPTLPRGESTSFTVQAKPGTKGLKTAVLHIASNDPDEGLIDITLLATGVTAAPPAATTLPASAVSFSGATLNGSVNAKGVERDVIFEYGTTTAYGAVATAAPATATGSAASPFSTVLAELPPHTKYHYRIRASAAAGSANGKDSTFTTATRAPVAVADSLLALPSGKFALPVLANDTDADGDALTVFSFTPVTPATAGKVAKVGTSLVFTPSATFAGGASFTYIASDAFGGRSAPAAVTLGLGSCTVAENVTIPSDSPPFQVTVTANAPWTVSESLPWLTVDAMRPAENAERFVPLPNPSPQSRSGTVTIGGKMVTVTQQGVTVVPVLTRPDFVPQAAIGASYSLAIPTQFGPVKYTATGLPKGLSLSNTTGLITGMPTVAGTSTVVILANNAKGSSNPISFDLTVLPFPTSLLGGYTASIQADPLVTEDMGGLLTMNVTGVGTVTGTLKVGAGSHSFTGKLNTAPNPEAPDPEHATLTVTVPRRGKPALWLLVVMNTDQPGHVFGQVNLVGPDGVVLWDSVALINGTQNVWNAASHPATGLDGTYHVSLQSQGGSEDPRGLGFVTVKVTLGGVATWSGQLADGTILKPTTVTLMSTGELPLFAALYGGKGSLSQTLWCHATGSGRFMDGTLAWCKKPQPSARAYPDGFANLSLSCIGAAYAPPAAGKTLLNRNAPATVAISFAYGEIEPVSQFSVLDQTFQVSAQHQVSFSTSPSINPAKVGISKLDVVNGTFAGSFTLSDPNPFNSSLPPVTRTVNFTGLIISGNSGGGNPIGVGYFLLPEIAGPPANVKTSRLMSGHVLLQ